MKKFLAISLVLCVVLCALPASLKVGGNLGFGLDLIKKSTSGDTIRYLSYGPAADLRVEYDLDDYISFGGDVKVMYLGKTMIRNDSTGYKKYDDFENSGLALGAAFDVKYTFYINDRVLLSPSVGLDTLYSYVYKKTGVDNSAKRNFGLGVKAGGEVAYLFNSSLSLRVGVESSWLFVNTTKYLKSDRAIISSFVLRPYVGVMYAL